MGHDYQSRRPAAGGPDRSRAVLMRDAALARVRRARRWVIAGAAVLTAGFAALVSAVAPGRSLASKTSAGATSSASTASPTGSAGSALPSMPAPASASDLGLQSPDQAPSPDQSTSPGQSSSPDQAQPSQPQPAPQPDPSPTPAAPQSSGGGGGGGGVVSGGS